MIDKIEKCYVCDQWFDVKALRQIKVSSQGGDVEKPICEGCIEAIEKRSNLGTRKGGSA
jgi:hypothetical protein